MPPEPSSFSGPRAIVADDSLTFRSALEAVLRRSGIVQVVATVSDGDEAIEAFVRLGADLVIADVMMPRVNGLDMTAALRRLSTRVRILLVSVHDGRHLEAECLEHGADSFIPKLALNRRLWPEIRRLFPGVAALGERPQPPADALPVDE